MSSPRAEILSVDFPDTAAARIVISAPAEKIFNLLADARSHHLFDGSGTVHGSFNAPDRLYLGAKFGMSMKIKVPYRITNTVVAFEENRKITWSHLMKWTWSYELREIGSGQVEVTEIFDAHNIPRISKWWFYRTTSLERNAKWMAKSLVALKLICEA
jgi:hypothetical protein